MGETGLRILQVMRAPVGGLFRHVADLTRALNAKGHEIGLVVDSLSADSQTEAKLAALAPHVTLGIHRIAMPRVLGPGDVTAPLAVRKLARDLNIDILHGHGAKGGVYARLARVAGAKAKAIYTPHGGVLHFTKSSGSGRVFHAAERWLMGQTSAIVFESAFAEKTYAALIGRPTCPTIVVHNGLEATEFEPVTPLPDAADFVFVGELRDLKGIFVLIEALAGVTRPDGTGANLVMAGDGAERGALESQIAALGLGDRVTLLGAQPARPSFAKGKIAVVPSLAESLPYVVLEAGAARLPVIASDVGGIPEIFGSQKDKLVPADDVTALRAAMQATLNNPNESAACAEKLSSFIAANFSAAKMSGKIETLYSQSLRGT